MKASDFNKNFIKDLKLPIAVDKAPYFEHYLELTSPYYGSVEKYETFKRDFESFGSQFFFEHNRKTVNGTLDMISASPEYARFNAMDMSVFNKEIKISAKDLYKSDKADKKFYSIDLVKANFQSLLLVEPTIFGGHTDYAEFAISRGFNEYMLISKITRQILFGNLNPKRQQKVQYFMMNQIADKLIKAGVDVSCVYSLSSDELVFEQGDYKKEAILDAIAPLGYNVRLEAFTLRKPFDKPFYVKERDDGSVEFKMVPTAVMAEFIKRFEGRAVEDIDLYFYDESKRLAKFFEPAIEN
jgi:hypothetical protein